MTIARIFGIPVRVDWSWLLVFAFFVVALASTGGPFGNLSAALRVAVAAATVFVLFGCVVFHEAAHALTARSHGIPTKEISLFAFGGVSRLESTGATPAQQVRIAAAGPIASIALAVVFGSLAMLVSDSETPFRILSYLAGINAALAFFNLLPCNPLDGGRILGAFVWSATQSRERAIAVTTRASTVVGSLMLAAGVLLIFTGVVANGIWVMFLAWFILQASRAEWTSELLTAALAPQSCAALMDSPGEALEPDVTCAYGLERMIALQQRSMPIATSGTLIGLLTLSDFSKIGNRDPERLYVTAIMTPASGLLTVSPAVPAIEGFRRLASCGYHQLPVVDETGHLQGFITRETLLRTLTFVTEHRAAVPGRLLQYVQHSRS